MPKPTRNKPINCRMIKDEIKDFRKKIKKSSIEPAIDTLMRRYTKQYECELIPIDLVVQEEMTEREQVEVIKAETAKVAKRKRRKGIRIRIS